MNIVVSYFVGNDDKLGDETSRARAQMHEGIYDRVCSVGSPGLAYSSIRRASGI